MQHLLRHFIRSGPGHWTCIEAVDVITPAGRMQVTVGTLFIRGKNFMNFDVAAELDAEYASTQDEQRPNRAS